MKTNFITMKEIRTVGKYFLFYDLYMKKYIVKHIDRFSYWFEMQNTDLVMSLTDDEFIKKCEEELDKLTDYKF